MRPSKALRDIDTAISGLKMRLERLSEPGLKGLSFEAAEDMSRGLQTQALDGGEGGSARGAHVPRQGALAP